MTRRILATVVLVCGVAAAACENSPTDAGVKAQYDGRSKTRTTTTMTTQSDSTSTGQIGDPCDPETYQGPYRCIENPDAAVGGYVIAY